MKLSSLCMAGSVIAAAGMAENQAPRPNIIYILLDDLGWGDVGFNGQEKIKTPVLDQLAAQGAVFNNYYTGSTVCTPSRVCLLTGMHTGHSVIRNNSGWSATRKGRGLDVDGVTVARELQQAGYATACIGKWGLGRNQSHPLKQGFDEFWGFISHGEAHFHWPDYVWHGEEKVDLGGVKNWEEKRVYADDLFTDKALDFIQHSQGHPFFLYLAYIIPHMGISVPEDSQLPYRNLGWPERTMPNDHYRNDPDTNVSYAGMVSRVDGYVKRILDALDALGLRDNTLIVFSSDNGPEYDDGFFNSSGIFSGRKRDLLEGGVRTPAIFYWPKEIPPGTKVDHLCAFWDILPTFCDLAGREAPKDIDGISFAPVLTGHAEQQQEHEYLYWEFNQSHGPIQAVRFGKWKAIRYWDFLAGDFLPIELYSIEKDTRESENIAPANPEVAERALRYMVTGRTENPIYPLLPRRK